MGFVKNKNILPACKCTYNLIDNGPLTCEFFAYSFYYVWENRSHCPNQSQSSIPPKTHPIRMPLPFEWMPMESKGLPNNSDSMTMQLLLLLSLDVEVGYSRQYCHQTAEIHNVMRKIIINTSSDSNSQWTNTEWNWSTYRHLLYYLSLFIIVIIACIFNWLMLHHRIFFHI